MGLQEHDENVVNFWEQSHYHRFIIDSSQQPGELSDIWRKLLGTAPKGTPETLNNRDTMANIDDEMVTPPSLADDPWSELVHGQGVEMVDLQQIRLADVHISLSEMEVEQALQVMQEQPAKNINQNCTEPRSTT
jgi:hypothetical protein